MYARYTKYATVEDDIYKIHVYLVEKDTGSTYRTIRPTILQIA
jgi:hypothetical protein